MLGWLGKNSEPSGSGEDAQAYTFMRRGFGLYYDENIDPQPPSGRIDPEAATISNGKNTTEDVVREGPLFAERSRDKRRTEATVLLRKRVRKAESKAVLEKNSVYGAAILVPQLARSG